MEIGSRPSRPNAVNAKPETSEAIDMIGDEGTYDNQQANFEIALKDGEMIHVSQDSVAQSFSHFSYIASGRKLLLCDLQGSSRGRDLIQFTDPVLHSQQGGKYGKTDRGAKGIEDFLNSAMSYAMLQQGYFLLGHARTNAVPKKDNEMLVSRSDGTCSLCPVDDGEASTVRMWDQYHICIRLFK